MKDERKGEFTVKYVSNRKDGLKHNTKKEAVMVRGKTYRMYKNGKGNMVKKSEKKLTKMYNGVKFTMTRWKKREIRKKKFIIIYALLRGHPSLPIFAVRLDKCQVEVGFVDRQAVDR